MSDSNVTSIDNIHKLLGGVLGSFPNYVMKSDSYSLEIVPFLEENSEDFCSSISQRSILVGQDPSKQGGFGIVGPLYVKTVGGTRILYVTGISFESYDGLRQCSNVGGCKWVSYDVEVLVKSSLESQTVTLTTHPSRTHPGVTVYSSNDTLNESIVGGLASYLYDLGVAPCVSKQFGYYICKDRRYDTPKYNTSLIVEKSSMEMLSILGGLTNSRSKDRAIARWRGSSAQKILSTMSANDLVIWTCHVARTLFVLKYHFGISHLDCHLRNVLLTIVTDKFGGIGDTAQIDMVYGGKHVSTVEYFSYALPNGKRMILENNGLIPKLIDYGISVADFPSSVTNDIPVRFVNEHPGTIPGWRYASSDRSGYGDVDYNFFVYCVVFQLYRAANDIGIFGFNEADKRNIQAVYRQYFNFAKHTVKNFSLTSIIKVDYGAKEIKYDIAKALRNPNEWTFAARNIGTTPNIATPLNNIYSFLSSSGFANENGDIVVTSSGRSAIIRSSTVVLGVGYTSDCSSSNTISDGIEFQGCPEESEFISRTKQFLTACVSDSPLDPSQKLECRKLKLGLNASNPKNVFSDRIVPPDIRNMPALWEQNQVSMSGGRLKMGITLNDLNELVVLNKIPDLAMVRLNMPISFNKSSKLHIIYVASKSLCQLNMISQSKSAYGLSSSTPSSKTSVSIVGGWFDQNVPYGAFKIDDTFKFELESDTIEKAVVVSNGTGLEIIPYHVGEKYEDKRFVLTAPLAIKRGQEIITTFNDSNRPITRGLLGLTRNKEILYIMSEGDDTSMDGLTANQLAVVGIHFGMVVAVHMVQGSSTNALITTDHTTKWVMSPSMHSSAESSLVLSLISNR